MLDSSSVVCDFQLEVLAETEAMIPDTKSRLTRALEDLEEFMVGDVFLISCANRVSRRVFCRMSMARTLPWRAFPSLPRPVHC